MFRPALRNTLYLACFLAASCGDDGSSGADGGIDSGPTIDATPMIDANVVDCSADYAERGESQNDIIIDDTGVAEVSNLGLEPGQTLSICGEISPDEQDGDFVDADVFEFRVELDMTVRIELTSESGDSLEGFELSLFSANGPMYLGVGPYVTDFGVITMDLERGTYWAGVVAKTPAPANAIKYTVELSESGTTCTTPGSPDFTEAGDDGDSRGNDTVAIEHPDITLTADDGDAPEAAGLTLMPGTAALIEGTTADVPEMGDYRDRDTYLISTGANVDELELKLSWADDVGVDLDVYLFAADDITSDYSTGAGTTIGTGGAETFTVAVLPNQDYWLWIGAYREGGTLPQNYGVTLCPRNN